jgi:hypothetical protein
MEPTLDTPDDFPENSLLLPLTRRFCFDIALDQIGCLLNNLVRLPLPLESFIAAFCRRSSWLATTCFSHTRYSLMQRLYAAKSQLI